MQFRSGGVPAWQGRVGSVGISLTSMIGALLASAAPAVAQVVPPPNVPQPPTRQEIENPVSVEPTTRPGARLEIEGGIERTPCALDRPEYASIRFTVTGAEFGDTPGIDPALLRPAFADYIGTEQPLAVVCEIRDNAAALLRNAGYIAAVQVPEQRIENGVVRFRLLVAKIVDIRVRGDAGNNERLIASYLQRLVGQPAFNRFEAERTLLLADDLPGYTVRLALRPSGTAPGEVVGEVTVVRVAGQLDINVQNYNAEATGRGGLLARAQFFGLTGLGDRTVLAAYSSADFEEQQTLQASHDFAIGNSGLRLSGQLTYSWSNPTIGIAGFDIRSQTLFATLEASYPLIRTQRYSLRARGGMDIVDQDVFFNSIPLSRDHLRVAYARLDFEAYENVTQRLGPMRIPRWRAAGGIEVRQGIEGLGASEGCGVNFVNCLQPGFIPPSQLEGEAGATVIRANIGGEWRPVPWLGIYVAAAAQYTDQPLLSFEEFSAGNFTIGRGYDPGIITGDRGGGVQGELRFGNVSPRPGEINIQPYVFVDAAWVTQRDRFVTLPSDDIQSVGGGIRAFYGDAAQLDVTFAVPLATTAFQTERPDPRLLITLTTRLLPWSSQ